MFNSPNHTLIVVMVELILIIWQIHDLINCNFQLALIVVIAHPHNLTNWWFDQLEGISLLMQPTTPRWTGLLLFQGLRPHWHDEWLIINTTSNQFLFSCQYYSILWFQRGGGELETWRNWKCSNCSSEAQLMMADFANGGFADIFCRLWFLWTILWVMAITLARGWGLMLAWPSIITFTFWALKQIWWQP